MQSFEINTKHSIYAPKLLFLNGWNLPRTKYFNLSFRRRRRKRRRKRTKRGNTRLTTLGSGTLPCSTTCLAKGQKLKVILLEPEKISPLTVMRQYWFKSITMWNPTAPHSSSCILTARWKEIYIFQPPTCHIFSFSQSLIGRARLRLNLLDKWMVWSPSH